MKITTIRTRRVRPHERGLERFLDVFVKQLKEGSVLAITSKVAAILEGAVVPVAGTNKAELIAREAELWLPPQSKRYPVTLTIKGGILAATAGIDESNGDGSYILWPRNPQRTANTARQYLTKKFGLRRFGIIVTDSTSAPLRWGTRGVALAWSGFAPLKNYIGTKDLFGRRLKVTKVNVVDGLAAAAVLAMGEGAECTPLARLEDLPFVSFKKMNPSAAEIRGFRIRLKDDLYAPLLMGPRWRKGKGSSRRAR